jgi:hypothetical protein
MTQRTGTKKAQGYMIKDTKRIQKCKNNLNELGEYGSQ